MTGVSSKSPEIVLYALCPTSQSGWSLQISVCRWTPQPCPHTAPNLSIFMCSGHWALPAVLGDGERRARLSLPVCCLCFTVSASGHCTKLCANTACAARSLWHKSKEPNTPRDWLCEHPGVSSGSRGSLSCLRHLVLPVALSVPLSCLHLNWPSFPKKLWR